MNELDEQIRALMAERNRPMARWRVPRPAADPNAAEHRQAVNDALRGHNRKVDE